MFDYKQINDRAFQYYNRLQKVRQYIGENYSESISLKKAAQIAGVERKYFSAFFRKKVGVCFSHWLMWVRVNEAMRLIETNNQSITQTAFAIGYSDLRTFERAFKLCTGFTPREFKKAVQSQHEQRYINHDN